MTAIPHAAEALTSAFGRFERASQRLLEAVTGLGQEDGAAALLTMIEAKAQARAAVAVVHVSDDMWRSLIDVMIAREGR